MNEPLTITPHWGDRARDAYWSNPTKAQFVALMAFVVVVGGIAAAIV